MRERLLMLEEDIRSTLCQRNRVGDRRGSKVDMSEYEHIINENVELKDAIKEVR